MDSKKQKIKSIIFLIISALFMLLLTWLIGKPLLKFSADPEKFREWIDGFGIWSQLVFVVMVVVQVIFAIIPGEPLEIAAGYAFGAIEGTILCVIASLIGSVIVFVFVKRFGKRFVEFFYSVEKLNNLKYLKNTKKLNLFAFFIFLIPGTPKDLLVYFLGLTKIDISAFLLTVSIGRLPSIITSTVGGNALGMQNYLFAIITFVVTMLISLGGYIAYQSISKHLKNKK